MLNGSADNQGTFVSSFTVKELMLMFSSFLKDIGKQLCTGKKKMGPLTGSASCLQENLDKVCNFSDLQC